MFFSHTYMCTYSMKIAINCAVIFFRGIFNSEVLWEKIYVISKGIKRRERKEWKYLLATAFVYCCTSCAVTSLRLKLSSRRRKKERRWKKIDWGNILPIKFNKFQRSRSWLKINSFCSFFFSLSLFLPSSSLQSLLWRKERKKKFWATVSRIWSKQKRKRVWIVIHAWHGCGKKSNHLNFFPHIT